MEVQVRAACHEDFTEVFRLFGQLWPNKELHEEEMRAVYTRGLESPTDQYICVVYEEKVVGFCAMAYMNNFWQEGRIAYLYAMIVDEPLRKKGIGVRLLEKAYNLAQAVGCKKIELDSAFHREGAHKFYKINGYEKRAFLFSKDIA